MITNTRHSETVIITKTGNATTTQIINAYPSYRIIVSKEGHSYECKRLMSLGMEAAMEAARYYAAKL